MIAEGNLRKMKSELEDQVQYYLTLADIQEPLEPIPLNQFIGRDVKLSFEHAIHCVITGKKIKKAFGEGMSYEAFMNSPQASPSIVRPELSRIHEGIALRDYDWEVKHHLQPHIVYLSQTSGVKVGVTRTTQVPYRWIDQGAIRAIEIARVPYRQLAGLIEVALKDHVADKTHWQKMLKNDVDLSVDLNVKKEELTAHLDDELGEYITAESEVIQLNFPVLEYPQKVTSTKLDKVPEIEGKLVGIKGQYWMFEGGRVINIRSHSGYRIKFEV